MTENDPRRARKSKVEGLTWNERKNCLKATPKTNT